MKMNDDICDILYLLTFAGFGVIILMVAGHYWGIGEVTTGEFLILSMLFLQPFILMSLIERIM